MQQPANSASAPPTITTEQIQKMLDENKQLILAILENQNLGKLAECATYQSQLQKNLVYLAAIADAQPQAPSTCPQLVPQAGLQPAGHYAQQPSFFPPRPMQFNPQHQVQQPQHHPQLMPIPVHMGVRPGAMNGMHPMPTEVSHGVGSEPPPSASLTSSNGRGRQDTGAPSESAFVDGHRNSRTEHGNENPEASHQKRPDDGNN